MIARQQHSVNGKLRGMWYEFENGQSLYLAHRRGVGRFSSGLIAKKNAWGIEKTILHKAAEIGCKFIGVLHFVDGKKLLYVTHLADFWESPFSDDHMNGGWQHRLLPRDRFMLNPSNSEGYIARMMKLR